MRVCVGSGLASVEVSLLFSVPVWMVISTQNDLQYLGKTQILMGSVDEYQQRKW